MATEKNNDLQNIHIKL